MKKSNIEENYNKIKIQILEHIPSNFWIEIFNYFFTNPSDIKLIGLQIETYLLNSTQTNYMKNINIYNFIYKINSIISINCVETDLFLRIRDCHQDHKFHYGQLMNDKMYETFSPGFIIRK